MYLEANLTTVSPPSSSLASPSGNNKNGDESGVPQIIVDNAEKHGDGFKDAYVTYEIITRFPHSREEHRVRRRYQDFIWLLSKISTSESGADKDSGMGTGMTAGLTPVIIPPLPEKNRLEYMDRFSPDFIRRRQVGLERFLRRLTRHPRLQKHPVLESFLTKPILGIDEDMSEEGGDLAPGSSTSSTTTGSSLVDSLLSVFSGGPGKGRTVEERFLVMRKLTGVLESNFDKVTEGQSRLVAGYRGLSDALLASASAFSQASTIFSQLDRVINSDTTGSGDLPTATTVTPVRTLLGDLGQAAEEESVCAVALADDLELRGQLLTSEYANYCRSARALLKYRDLRQYECQDLCDALAEARTELSTLTGGSSLADGSAASGGGSNSTKTAIVNFFTEKVDQMRGLDPVTARAERIRRLERRCEELELSVARTRARSEAADRALADGEYSTFLDLLGYDFVHVYQPGIQGAWRKYQSQLLQIWSD